MNMNQTVKQGEAIFFEGEPGNCAYIIESGSVELSILVDGELKKISQIQAGALFGEMALIGNHLRTATAIAVEHTELIVIPEKYVAEKLENSDKFVALLLKILLQRYLSMRTRLDDVMTSVKTDANLMVSECSLPECSRDTVVAALQLEAEHNLKKALETGQLELFYQPIIALDTLQVVGCESLIRWRHPQRGLVPPVEFIGLAEESGLIIPIGHWIIQEAIQACQRFRHKSSHFAFVSINLSGKQFIPGDLVDYIQGIFQQEQIDPKHIKFEITESILMANPLDAAASLEALKTLGSTIAIDDFGTGYSSLSYLHRFPIDTLKIDKSFVSTMLENAKSHEIVKSLCILAKALEMSIVAEGIEKVEEHQRMRKMGVNYGQGYFYAKPMPEAEFCEYLLKYQSQAVVDVAKL